MNMHRNITEHSKYVIQRLHPNASITFTLNLTPMLGGTIFPRETKNVLITTAQEGWYLFWFRDRCLVLPECDIYRVSVADVARRVKALKDVGLLRLYVSHDAFENICDGFPFRDGEFITCIDQAQHVIDIQLATAQMSEKQARFLDERHIECDVFGETGPW
jgi:hypothetical protein